MVLPTHFIWVYYATGSNLPFYSDISLICGDLNKEPGPFLVLPGPSRTVPKPTMSDNYWSLTYVARRAMELSTCGGLYKLEYVRLQSLTVLQPNCYGWLARWYVTCKSNLIISHKTCRSCLPTPPDHAPLWLQLAFVPCQWHSPSSKENIINHQYYSSALRLYVEQIYASHCRIITY